MVTSRWNPSAVPAGPARGKLGFLGRSIALWIKNSSVENYKDGCRTVHAAAWGSGAERGCLQGQNQQSRADSWPVIPSAPRVSGPPTAASAAAVSAPGANLRNRALIGLTMEERPGNMKKLGFR